MYVRDSLGAEQVQNINMTTRQLNNHDKAKGA